MEPTKQAVGIVVRADGTVPIEDDVPEAVRNHIIAHLTDRGHTVSHIDGTRHLKVQNWTKGKTI